MTQWLGIDRSALQLLSVVRVQSPLGAGLQAHISSLSVLYWHIVVSLLCPLVKALHPRMLHLTHYHQIFIYFKFSLEVVSRYRDPQLQVGEKYEHLLNWNQTFANLNVWTITVMWPVIYSVNRIESRWIHCSIDKRPNINPFTPQRSELLRGMGCILLNLSVWSH